MRSFAILSSLALGSSALAVPELIARAENTTTELVAAIGTISSDIMKLNTTLNGFKPDSTLDAVNALTIQTQTDQIGTDLKDATAIVNRSGNFSEADSATVGSAVLQLEPTIASLLNNIVVHKPSFASVLFILDLSQTVEADLKDQKQLSNEFGTALGPKLAGIFGFGAPIVNNQIQEYFTEAIGNYSACTGAVCLPPIQF